MAVEERKMLSQLAQKPFSHGISSLEGEIKLIVTSFTQEEGSLVTNICPNLFGL